MDSTKILLFVFSLSSVFALSPLAEQEVYIAIGNDASGLASRSTGAELISKKENFTMLRMNESEVAELSAHMHEDFNRCGGYFAFESAEAAEEFLNEKPELNTRALFNDYSINQSAIVGDYVAQVDDIEIESTIRHLSSYRNRYYKSDTGVEAAEWIASKWDSLLSHRSDSHVDLYNHASWAQDSVIATIQGRTDDVIVIGGHLDSIAGWFGGSHVHAPGADDNASGISTITEVIRILGQNGYVPEHTIKFMGYAAEEVGLRGSNEIARDFKDSGVNVVGVMQLDMTNFNGSSREIYLIDDNTNRAQNEFLGRLIDEYLGVEWGWTSCGYACSDHASWHQQGFSASFPFEAAKNGMNGKIHTANDTIEQSDGHARHAAHFAKLAVAFIVELDR